MCPVGHEGAASPAVKLSSSLGSARDVAHEDLEADLVILKNQGKISLF